MVNKDLAIARAEAAVEERRAALLGTVDELSDMFEPRKIVQEVWESAKVKGADLAEDAVDAVKRRPVAAGGVLAALTMFLAREPIRDGIVSIYDAVTSKKSKANKAAPKAPDAPNDPATPPPPRRPRARRERPKAETNK